MRCWSFRDSAAVVRQSTLVFVEQPASACSAAEHVAHCTILLSGLCIAPATVTRSSSGDIIVSGSGMAGVEAARAPCSERFTQAV